MKIVLDTNCLLPAIFEDSPHYWIWEAFENGKFTTPYYKWSLITADPDDNKFVDCALNGGTDYIITNDKHFNVLKETDFPYVKVVSSEEFRKILISR